jgi:hypothetical protein
MGRSAAGLTARMKQRSNIAMAAGHARVVGAGIQLGGRLSSRRDQLKGLVQRPTAFVLC